MTDKTLPLKRKRPWTLWLAIGVGVVILAVVVLLVIKPEIFKSDRARFEEFVALTQGAAGPRIMEGLPHQMFETGPMEEEIKAKKTFEIHGYHFYQEELDSDPALIKETIPLLLDWKVTRPTEYTGTFKCGGFHPDYMLQWSRLDGSTIEAMLCFGCGEAKIFADGNELYCTMFEYKKIKQIFGERRKNRPPVTGF